MFRLLILLSLLTLILASSVQAGINDPTRPPGLNSVPARSTNIETKGPRWVLSSTLVSSARKTAVINNKIVGLGERIRGATVVEIEPSSVRLRFHGNQINLVLVKTNVKILSRRRNGQQGKLK